MTITSNNHSIFMAGFEMQPDTIKKSRVSSSVPSLIDTKVDELLLFPNRPKQVVPSMTYIDNTKISPRTMNIRDMLDEGDGIEDDINAKRRNQQWKTILEPANKRRKLHESHQHKFITAERLKLRLPQKEEVAGSKVEWSASDTYPKMLFTSVIDALEETKTSHISSGLKARHTKGAGLAYGSDLVCLLNKRDC